MASVRFGDQHDDVVHKKTMANSKVTARTTMPPTVDNFPESSRKSATPDKRRARVSKRYKGWGQTIHGFEGC